MLDFDASQSSVHRCLWLAWHALVLEVGNLEGANAEVETRSHFGAWCITSSPLMCATTARRLPVSSRLHAAILRDRTIARLHDRADALDRAESNIPCRSPRCCCRLGFDMSNTSIMDTVWETISNWEAIEVRLYPSPPPPPLTDPHSRSLPDLITHMNVIHHLVAQIGPAGKPSMGRPSWFSLERPR